ncbi:hypothetical protein [Curtobacterium sp. CFBP9011]|uniref:hypothetical protein n=1 Tax=Curtobacterium sp. CFBP9011 TaxID=3096530 RepID=UPI002A6B67D1|nr:hypothetical protein [Curtobacterium sp. CFBP9011]MDY1005715.1 hypothetical protein [Curtobacterium sp. CFBP9011]
MSPAEFHRRAVEDALTDAAEQTLVDRKAVALAEAQVHATVLLAEEQRTANLIALFDEEAPEVFRESRSDDPDERHRAIGRQKSRWLALSAEIAERLDIA